MKLCPLFIYLLTLNSMNIYQPTQYFPRCLPFTAYVPFLLDNIQKIFSESLLYLRQFSESFPQHTIYFMFDWSYIWLRASQIALVVKNMHANAGDISDMASIPWLERSLEEGMATHSSIIAWRIPRTEEPGRLHSVGS